MRHLTSTAVLALWLLVPIGAAAQGVEVENGTTHELARGPSAVHFSEAGSGRLVLTVPDFDLPIAERRFTPASPLRFAGQSVSEPKRRSPGRAVLGAIVGATGGFFAGGYTGAWIEGDRCHCDDPGLKGALIGAPIGAVVGGILGGLYLF